MKLTEPVCLWRGEMRRIVLLGVILIFFGACATPQGIKEASRQQGDLLMEFYKTLGDLRTKLLLFYDEEIEEFKQDLVKSRVAVEQYRVSQRVNETIRVKGQGVDKIKEILDAAANYLTELPNVYFDKEYCKVWPELKKNFLREPEEKCHDDHLNQYQKLLTGRKEVAKRFDRLVTDIGETREAHGLINEFLQIEYRLTREQVDEAKRAIEEGNKTIADAKAAWAEYRRKEGGTQ
jgi:hypothetical protein